MASPVTYMHTDIMDSRIYSFIYNPQTCDGISQLCASQTCSNPNFLSVSPYGEWRVRIPDDTLNHMQNATEIRMAFKVAWHTSSDNQQANYSDAMFGKDNCTSSPVCFVQPNAKLISQEECDLPEFKLTRGPGPETSTGSNPCSQAVVSVFAAALFASVQCSRL